MARLKKEFTKLKMRLQESTEKLNEGGFKGFPVERYFGQRSKALNNISVYILLITSMGTECKYSSAVPI